MAATSDEEPRLAVPPIVSAAWLRERRGAVLVADVRWYLDGRSGRAAYDSGHIPGAVFVDLDQALADPPSRERGRHPLPTPARFAAELGALGIPDDATVVAYDDSAGLSAARLVWMLRRIGQPAALLDGGLPAWVRAAAGDAGADRGADAAARADPAPPLDRDPVVLAPVTRAVRAWPASALADIDEVASTSAALLDARAPERYAGEVEPIDPRAGHIPGARSVPFAGSLREDGTFLDPERLRARFGGEPAIAYCGSGVSACHLLLAHEAAGLGPGRLFPGSWSQWSGDFTRPIQTGSS